MASTCCRRCGVAGGERVPPAPLGWYSEQNEALKMKRVDYHNQLIDHEHEYPVTKAQDVNKVQDYY